MTVDPATVFRDMLGQWETMANQFGGAAMRSPETARAMGAATSAGAQAQQALRDGMARTLAAYNMPSREDLAALSERLGAVEDRLVRIETLLSRIAGIADGTPDGRTPPRSKKPNV